MSRTSTHYGLQNFVDGATFGTKPTFRSGQELTDADVAAAAAIAESKQEHQFRPRHCQPNTAATSETRVIHEVFGVTGAIIAFSAGSIGVAVGAATVTVDLKKNGVTVLSAVIT